MAALQLSVGMLADSLSTLLTETIRLDHYSWSVLGKTPGIFTVLVYDQVDFSLSLRAAPNEQTPKSSLQAII